MHVSLSSKQSGKVFCTISLVEVIQDRATDEIFCPEDALAAPMTA